MTHKVAVKGPQLEQYHTMHLTAVSCNVMLVYTLT